MPSPIEFLIYRAYAIYIAASLAPFYFDLVMDAIITYSYYTDEGARACQPASIFTTWSHSVSDNTCGLWHRHADNTRKRYFWLSLSFFLLGIVITCCFDFLTTIETAGDRKDKRRLTMLATKIALNIIHVRILYEAIGAYSARARSKIDKDRDGNSVARELIKIAARREAATAGNGTKDKLATDGGKGGGGRVGGGNASVSKRFCDEIADLVGTLDQTTAHFVRCIKPNGIFAPLKVDDEMVMLQLRNNGSLEAVQLMRAGFPTRVPYEVMVQRYKSSLENVPGVTDLSDAQFCEVLCAVAELSPEDYRLGVSKIFLRAGRGQFLEELGEKPAEEVLPVLRAKLEEWEARRRAMGTLLKWLFMLVRRCDFRKKRRCGLGWVGLGWGWMGRAGMGWLGWVGMG